MAQVEHVALGRNTSNERPRKARNWCFTLNNYEEKDITHICDGKYDYIFQEETGKEGTPHLQGLLCFPNAVSFNSIKKLIPKAHIESCRSKIASINYCKKGETRTGELFTNREDWKLGTKSGTLPDPRSMNISEKNIFIQKQVDETLDDHKKDCLGINYCWCYKI